MTPTDPTSLLLRPGSVLAGRWVLDAPLGDGAFGTVWRTHGTNDPDQVAAVKLLLNADEQTRARLHREGLLLQRIGEHPNIVGIVDCSDDDELPFLAMEYLKGGTLADRIARGGPLNVEAACDLARALLRALEAAHGVGVVHRDVKPENVLWDAQAKAWKLADFGISKVIGAGHDLETLTATGEVLCSPAYAAPELLRGEVDPQVDLYAVGHLLIEALTGRPVYAGDPRAVAVAQLGRDPVPVPEVVSKSPLGGVVTKAVEKEPGRRWASALAMLAAVEDALAMERQDAMEIERTGLTRLRTRGE